MIAYIEAQGSLLRMRVLGQGARPPVSSSVRGRIRGFSAKSRLRLLRFFARMRMTGVRATFITLTFKGYPTNEVAKLALHAFLQRIARSFPTASCVWRMEYQKRGSIHFHLLCFNLPYWDWKEILAAWKACSRQRIARIDVTLIKSRRGVQSYISKYIAKCDKKSGKAFFIHPPYLHGCRKWRKGRFWGYHNKKALPLGEKFEGLLTDTKAIKRLSNAAWEIIGSATRFGSLSFHLFYDKAVSIARQNVNMWGREFDEWEYTIKDHTRAKNTHHPYTDTFSDNELRIRKRLRLGKRVKGERSELVQPLTRLWLSRASLIIRCPVELHGYDK